MYIEAKIPTQPKEITVSKELFIKGVTLAQMIRTRHPPSTWPMSLVSLNRSSRPSRGTYFSEFAK